MDSRLGPYLRDSGNSALVATLLSLDLSQFAARWAMENAHIAP
jgi:hypothetical protein